MRIGARVPHTAWAAFTVGRRQNLADRDVGGRRLMPVSVEVHHALVDGLHVGRFYEAFQRRIHSADGTARE